MDITKVIKAHASKLQHHQGVKALPAPLTSCWSFEELNAILPGLAAASERGTAVYFNT